MQAIGLQLRKKLAHCNLKLRTANVNLQLSYKKRKGRKADALFFIQLPAFKAMAN
jgi:hypothetical protein